jgi:hypothetical protein
MINKKQLLILLGIVAIVVIAIVVVLNTGDKGDGPLSDGDDGVGPDAGGELAWPDAPDPAEDLEKLEQYRNLWPDIDDPPADREAVRVEWKEFAARYPQNLYIPNEYLAELSETELKERRELLDTIGTIESNLASARATARKDDSPAAGKEGPDAPAQAPVTPEQQKRYFDYKIRELESRIQLVQFTIEKGRMSADQLPDAQSELTAWQNNIEEYKQVRATIP